MIKLDELNKGILAHLRDGRKSYKKIADDLGVSENTIKARVRKLEAEDVLNVSGFVNPAAIEGHQVIYVGIKLDDLDYVEKGRQISKLRRVVSVGVVTGHYDMIVTVHLDSSFGLLEFLSEELGSIKGIQTTETFVVYKSFNITVPYNVENPAS